MTGSGTQKVFHRQRQDSPAGTIPHVLSLCLAARHRSQPFFYICSRPQGYMKGTIGVICILLGLAWPSMPAELPGIVTEAGFKLTSRLQRTVPARCLAVIRPYSTWAPAVKSSANQPTSSPIPPYIEGSIELEIWNTAGLPINAPWTLTIQNTHYREVVQV